MHQGTNPENSAQPFQNSTSVDQWIANLASMAGWQPTAKPEPRIRHGQVWAVGEHRLMCGDAGSKADVERLMGGAKASLVFTSPPYLDQRHYEGNAISDFDGLMARVFSNLPLEDNAQVLVNFGQVIRDGEVVDYTHPFKQYMRRIGYRHFDSYIWDKTISRPFVLGRLGREHEEIFHFNKAVKHPRKTILKKPENVIAWRGGKFSIRRADGTMRASECKPDSCSHTHKKHSSIFRVSPQFDNGRRKIHPAIFPLALAAEIIPIWTKEGEAVYEPFGGSGTVMLAAQALGRRCYAMEIEPSYVASSLKYFESKTGLKAVLQK